jgi:FMN phosphatase YigB (HAD superfamily)
MVDVGGTLWPNSWPFRESDAFGRRERIAAAMPDLEPAAVDALADDLINSSRPGDEARSISTEMEIVVKAEALIANSLARQGLPADPQTVTRLRRAMSIPISDRMKPLPGARELLAEIHALGMRTVIASNTYWRDADSYWNDFRFLGMAEHIDAIVTSVDAGHLKPHPAVFEMALRWAGSPPDRCVVIGNREENDILPALELGMRTILVHPDDPVPASSRAHAVAPDLWACAEVLRTMLEAP